MSQDKIKSLPNKKAKVAYFSMEVALQNSIPTFSGGLGILAGDTLKSAADLEVPMVAVTMMYNKGYFKQGINKEGRQYEEPISWHPDEKLELMPNTIEVQVEERNIKVACWKYTLTGITGHHLPVFFLDTNLPENRSFDREISSQLYSGDQYQRIVQEVVLGIGGIRMLDSLGYRDLETYHMNEGHAAFLTLELLTKHDWQDKEVAKRCVFTTHTPVSAGHDTFPYPLAYQVFVDRLPWHIKELAGKKKLNMTTLALNLSRYTNAVAKKHAEVSKNMFPKYKIDAITNGIHSTTWTSPSFKAVFDQYIPSWRKDPQLLAQAASLPNQEIAAAHHIEKIRLIDQVKEISDIRLDINKLTIGFARRAATYKRGDLIFSDLERLTRICKGKVQFVFAGKAHPKDKGGKDLIQRIINASKELFQDVKVIYLPNYDMSLGALLTSGVDLWLNTPIRPREASGTSGMKAAHNGIPNFSVLDGWWIEGHVEGITGWSIGPAAAESSLVKYDENEDIEDMYDKLENVIIPTYYENPEEWLEIMKQSIAQCASFFNTHRMVEEYIIKAYKLKKDKNLSAFVSSIA